MVEIAVGPIPFLINVLAALKGSQVLIFIYGLESRLGVLEWSLAAVLEWILEVEPWRESFEWKRKHFF